MPWYTQARLQYALDVFRDSLPYRVKRGFKTDNLEQQLKKYELRTSTVMTVTPRATLWIDKDDSGDYDPSQSKKRQPDTAPPKPRNNKRKERDLGGDLERDGPLKKAKAKTTWLSGRNRKAKLQQLANAGVPAPDVDDGPSLWALGGGSFSRSPRSSTSSAARRRSMFGPDPEGDDDNEDFEVCGLGLRTRTLPVLEAPEIPQKPLRCVPCRRAKRKCTRRKSDPHPSCTQCRKDGFDCSYGSPPFQEETAKQVTLGDQDDYPITIESPSSARLKTQRITTSFVHPINFKFSAAQDPDKTCDFCRDYRYGLVGCGSPKTVEVIVEGGRIVEEMKDGCRAKWREPTKMCIMCALHRFQICRCANHDVVPIAGLCPGDFDYPQAVSNFSTPGAPAFNHWCHFCISPAFFACGTPQQYNKVGQPVAVGVRREKGCGLLLCPECAAELEKVGMERDKLAEQIRKRGSWKARADMEFLFHGSDLHKAYYPF